VNSPIAAPKIRIYEEEFLTINSTHSRLLFLISVWGLAGAIAPDTHSFATGDRRCSEIVRRKDDAFDTSDLAVVARFPIHTGFGIVTYKLVRMAPPPGLAEPYLNFPRYFLVFGGLVLSQ
jgi:hypothetical protein